MKNHTKLALLLAVLSAALASARAESGSSASPAPGADEAWQSYYKSILAVYEVTPDGQVSEVVDPVRKQSIILESAPAALPVRKARHGGHRPLSAG